jgi:hypothetical protein
VARTVPRNRARLQGGRLAEFGFEADGVVFRRYNPDGDVVIVDLQPHRSFLGDTQFFVNLAFLLDPAWRHYGFPPEKRPGRSSG